MKCVLHSDYEILVQTFVDFDNKLTKPCLSVSMSPCTFTFSSCKFFGGRCWCRLFGLLLDEVLGGVVDGRGRLVLHYGAFPPFRVPRDHRPLVWHCLLSVSFKLQTRFDCGTKNLVEFQVPMNKSHYLSQVLRGGKPKNTHFSVPSAISKR